MEPQANKLPNDTWLLTESGRGLYLLEEIDKGKGKPQQANRLRITIDTDFSSATDADVKALARRLRALLEPELDFVPMPEDEVKFLQDSLNFTDWRNEIELEEGFKLLFQERQQLLTLLSDQADEIQSYHNLTSKMGNLLDELSNVTFGDAPEHVFWGWGNLVETVKGFKEQAQRSFPKELTPELREVLGQMNFQTGPIAHALQAGGVDIPRKAEDEQAYVLHWFINLVFEHGANWRMAASKHLGWLYNKTKGKITQDMIQKEFELEIPLEEAILTSEPKSTTKWPSAKLISWVFRNKPGVLFLYGTSDGNLTPAPHTADSRADKLLNKTVETYRREDYVAEEDKTEYNSLPNSGDYPDGVSVSKSLLDKIEVVQCATSSYATREEIIKIFEGINPELLEVFMTSNKQSWLSVEGAKRHAVYIHSPRVEAYHRNDFS